jgi:hypothetical protein
MNMQTDLNRAISPSEAARLAAQIICDTPAETLHAAFDRLSNEILCSLGYSDFVAAFKASIGDDHAHPRHVPDGLANPTQEKAA